MLNPGQQLRRLRESLQLTIRDVEAASGEIALRKNDARFSISVGGISEIESKDVLPTLHKVYSLAAIYGRDLTEILSYYGINAAELAADSTRPHRKTYLAPLTAPSELRMPVRIEPGLDRRTTSELTPFIREWGVVPLTQLAKLEDTKYRYGYIGTEDYTMYPLIAPGSFVQVDETKRMIAAGPWRAEYERPIYFLEVREGYLCSWCEAKEAFLLIQPHPLSPEKTRVVPHQAVDVIGQVVGVAMRLDLLLDPERLEPEMRHKAAL